MHAYIALLRYDADLVRKQRILTACLSLGAAAGLFLAIVAASEGELASETIGIFLTWVFVPVTALAAVLLTAPAINSEARVAADSFLSRATTREAYLAAKATTRLAAVVLGYLLVAAPAAALIARYGVRDVSVMGVVLTLLQLGALLWLLAALGLAASVLVRRAPLAVVATAAAAVAGALALEVLGIGSIGPLATIDALAEQLRGDRAAWRAILVTLVYGLAGAIVLVATLMRYRGRDL